MYFIGFDYKNEDIEWRKVYWFNGEETKYSVSNIGFVRNDKNNKLLKDNISKGYHRVNLTHKGEQRQFLIHRLVASVFIPNPDNKPEVNHKNGDKSCNYDYNLEWVTGRENMKHAFSNKLNVRKKKHNVTISKETIHEICKILESNTDLTFIGIGNLFGLNRNTISNIYHGATHRDISKYYNISNYEIKKDFSKSGDLSERTKYPDKLIHVVCQMIDAGKYTLQEIAKITAVDYQTVRNVYYGSCRQSISSQYNFSKTSENPLYEDKKKRIIKACELLDMGYNTKEVALKLGFPRSTIRNLYSGNTWEEVAKNYQFYKKKDQRSKSNKNKKCINTKIME